MQVEKVTESMKSVYRLLGVKGKGREKDNRGVANPKADVRGNDILRGLARTR